MWPGCLWERHTQVGKGTREAPVRVPIYTFRYVAKGDCGSSVRKEPFYLFLFNARSAALLQPCVSWDRKPERREKVIRLTCDLIEGTAPLARRAIADEFHRGPGRSASSVRGLRASLSLAAAALRGKILRVVDLHDNAAPEKSTVEEWAETRRGYRLPATARRRDHGA